jgi:hypothetical protein
VDLPGICRDLLTVLPRAKKKGHLRGASPNLNCAVRLWGGDCLRAALPTTGEKSD